MALWSKLACLGAVASLLAASGIAKAAPVVLTFEGLHDQEDIASYYNGGLGANPAGPNSGPGPSYGITFGTHSQVVVNPGDGSNFSNNPSGLAVMDFWTETADPATGLIDVTPGFSTGFSFYYALQTPYSVTVSVYDGLDGTGTLLASDTLPSTVGTLPWDVWVAGGMSFAGTARSVMFTGNPEWAAFDDMTFGADITASTPEPASLCLLGLGAAALLARRRRTVA